MKDTFYITTAIDYTNGRPHIGHAYEKVLADAIARYQRLEGRTVYFLTGVDQHGQKVQETAEKNGMEPLAYVKQITALFQRLLIDLDISNDGWAETTHETHRQVVQSLLQRLYDEGQIYKKLYVGFYSKRAEQFLTDKERGPDGEFGPEWGEVSELEEENYYFKLSEHVGWLRGYVTSHPDFVFPAHRRVEVLNAIERSDQDLCISRPKNRLTWGIELPFDKDFVNYVWFDALVNYLTFAGYGQTPGAGVPDFSRLWPCDAHVIGKDIMVPPHSIYWPIMLHALGFSDAEIPPLLVHGWWNYNGEKMSKSVGNVIDPAVRLPVFGVDGLRYYMLRDMTTGADADFSDARLLQAYNKDLANDLGNLLNRSLNMTVRYRSGIVSAASAHDDAIQQALRAQAEESRAVYREKMASYALHEAIAALWKLVGTCNQFIEQTAPFKLAKLPEEAARLDAVLHHLVEALAHIAILISPFMPRAARKMLEQLNASDLDALKLGDLKWGVIKDGHKVKEPTPLFPRLDMPVNENGVPQF